MAIQIWQPGDKIKNDRFHILKQLGKGGFGITYLAEDTIKKQQIVIKTLNANQQGEADFAQKQENFVKEGFTLKTFNHSHIVKVYEPIQIGELWGLVMEYIPGQDLADYIIANGRLGEAEALNYIDQIAQALDCVHQQKFFHRDVKPHNIMLRQDRGEAVLIDFGIAKEFVDLETIYLSNSLGTELYKPIEQYEKRGQFGAYTDIYALAVTLYHLLTGAAPGGGSPLYTSKARKDAQDRGWGANLDEHLWGELVKAGISESTQAAIKAGMAIEPSQRPQNMAEFRQLLELVKEREIEIEDELDINQTWFEKGNDLLESDRYEKTLSSYDRALKIHPDNPTSWRCRGYTLDMLGRHEEAVTSYDCALKIKPDNFYAWYFRGSALDALGRHEEAATSYDCALKIKPDKHHDWCKRGKILTNLGKYDDAIDSYDRALKIQPDNYDALYSIVTIFYGQHKYIKALEICEDALKINSDNPSIVNLHYEILEKSGMRKKVLAEAQIYDRENILINVENIDFKTLDEDPFAGLAELLSEEEIDSNDLNLSSESDHDKNCFKQDNNPPELDRYKNTFEKHSYDFVEIRPKIYNPFFIDVNLLFDRNRQLSMTHVEQLSERLLANNYKATSALNRFKECSRLERFEDYQIFIERARILIELNRKNEAIPICNFILKNQPDNYEISRSLGFLFDELGEYKQAIDSFNLALQIKPYHADTRQRCAVVKNKLRRQKDTLIRSNRAK